MFWIILAAFLIPLIYLLLTSVARKRARLRNLERINRRIIEERAEAEQDDTFAIHRDDMFPPILEACPSFQTAWDDFIREYEDEMEASWEYHVLAELARHLVSMYERNEIDQIRAVFQVVEAWHLDGDPFVKNAATVGLLEDLQNTGLHEGSTRPDDFLEFLLPETKYWWFKVIDFWEHGTLIVDDRPKQ